MAWGFRHFIFQEQRHVPVTVSVFPQSGNFLRPAGQEKQAARPEPFGGKDFRARFGY
jgi:hypothetical protein